MAEQAGAVLGRTTNFRRTVSTLEGVVTGLYPDAAEVPTHTAGDLDEIMYANVDGCSRLGHLMAAQRQALAGLPPACAVVLTQPCCLWLLMHLPCLGTLCCIKHAW